MSGRVAVAFSLAKEDGGARLFWYDVGWQQRPLMRVLMMLNPATFEAVARWAGTQDLSTHSVCLKVRERYSTVMLPILKPEVNRRKYLGPQRRMKSFTALHESMNTAGSRSAM